MSIVKFYRGDPANTPKTTMSPPGLQWDPCLERQYDAEKD